MRMVQSQFRKTHSISPISHPWRIGLTLLQDQHNGKSKTSVLVLTKNLILSSSESGTGLLQYQFIYFIFLYILIKLEILNSFIFRYFSIVRNRFFSIHLFPEPSKVSKDHPPVARFILRVSVAGSSRKFIVSPGKVNMHQSFFVNSLCC